MGFALWIADGVAHAEGTHEYRPLGAAVVAAGTVLTARDFRPHARSMVRGRRYFRGYFASLGDVNHYLKRVHGQSGRGGDGRVLATF